MSHAETGSLRGEPRFQLLEFQTSQTLENDRPKDLHLKDLRLSQPSGNSNPRTGSAANR